MLTLPLFNSLRFRQLSSSSRVESGGGGVGASIFSPLLFPVHSPFLQPSEPPRRVFPIVAFCCRRRERGRACSLGLVAVVGLLFLLEASMSLASACALPSLLLLSDVGAAFRHRRWREQSKSLSSPFQSSTVSASRKTTKRATDSSQLERGH
jgi:hypothetical protein